MLKGQGEMQTTAQGAKRESNSGRGRFDLIPYEAMEAWAKWTELGADKYGDRNWEKGLSVKDCINRMVRHAVKAANGWTDEDHLAATMWNAAAAITMMTRRPDCNDHPWKDKEEKVEQYGDDKYSTEIIPFHSAVTMNEVKLILESHPRVLTVMDETSFEDNTWIGYLTVTYKE